MSESIKEKYPEMDYFMNESKSDITLIIDGQKIPANRMILSFKSKVFEAMLSGHFKESTQNEIEIKDCKYESFKIMLKYVYCEKLVINDTIDYQMAIDVYVLGHRFQLNRLMSEMEQKLIQMITISNIDMIYKFASLYSTQQLLKTLKDLMKEYTESFVKKEMSEIIKINSATDNCLLENITNELLNSVPKARYESLLSDYNSAKTFFGPLTQKSAPNHFCINGFEYEKTVKNYDPKDTPFEFVYHYNVHDRFKRGHYGRYYWKGGE